MGQEHEKNKKSILKPLHTEKCVLMCWLTYTSHHHQHKIRQELFVYISWSRTFLHETIFKSRELLK